MIPIPNYPSIVKKGTSLLITWKQVPFKLTISILWHGIYFPVTLNSFKTKYGETNTATIVYKDKSFSRSMTKFKYMGGSHGDRFPNFETSTHELWLKVYLHGFEVVDVSKDPNVSDSQKDDPIAVFYMS